MLVSSVVMQWRGSDGCCRWGLGRGWAGLGRAGPWWARPHHPSLQHHPASCHQLWGRSEAATITACQHITSYGALSLGIGNEFMDCLFSIQCEKVSLLSIFFCFENRYIVKLVESAVDNFQDMFHIYFVAMTWPETWLRVELDIEMQRTNFKT